MARRKGQSDEMDCPSLLDFPDHTILLEREILLHDAINFKTEIFYKFHIFSRYGSLKEIIIRWVSA